MITNETIETILSRRSVRAYKSDSIPKDILDAVIEAGKAAPYVAPDSRHFSVMRNRDTISRMAKDAAAEGMKVSDFHRELFSAPGFDGTYGAPVIIVLSGNESSVQYEAVCAASVQNMLIAAKSLGVSSCWAYFPIFAFHGEAAAKWRAELRIPEGYKPCAAILFGYGADKSAAENPEEGAGERYRNTVAYL